MKAVKFYLQKNFTRNFRHRCSLNPRLDTNVVLWLCEISNSKLRGGATEDVQTGQSRVNVDPGPYPNFSSGNSGGEHAPHSGGTSTEAAPGKRSDPAERAGGKGRTDEGRDCLRSVGGSLQTERRLPGRRQKAASRGRERFLRRTSRKRWRNKWESFS